MLLLAMGCATIQTVERMSPGGPVLSAAELAAFDVHDLHGPPMWTAGGASIVYTVRQTGARSDLDVVVRRIDTGDVSNLTSAILDATCAETDPTNCPYSDQRSPIGVRPLE